MTANTLLALFLSFMTTVLAIVYLRAIAIRVGLVDLPSQRKRHGAAVPLLGGIAILGGIMVGTLTLKSGWAQPLPRAFMASLCVIGLAGVLDDLHEISPKVKLVFQLVACVMLTSWAGISIKNIGAISGDVPLGLLGWAIPFTLVAGIGLMNAVNMTDGIDGLVGSCSAITFGAMAYIASQVGTSQQYVSSLYVVIAAIFGFLVFNLPYGQQTRRTFLGDTGSLLIGLVILWYAIILSQAPINAAPPMVFVWLCGLFLIDFLSVIISRGIRGRSPLQADRRHFHHLLQRAGLNAKQTLAALVAIHTVCCVLGLAMWKFKVSELSMLGLAIVFQGVALFVTFSAPRWIRASRRTIRASSSV